MTNLITRTYTFTDGTTAYGSQVDSEIANIVNTINSLDQGNTTWTNVKVTTLLPQAAVNMGGYKITSIANGSAATDAVAFGQISNLNPTGSLLMYPLKAAPSGYLYCNGAAVSRGTYAALYSVIGSTFGYGDNSTTFNLPDYRGRFLRGVSDGTGRDPDAATRTTQDTGGNTGDAAGSLQPDTYAIHTHTATVTDPGHAHNLRTAQGNGATTDRIQFNAPDLNNTPATHPAIDSNTTGITVANSNAGSSETRPVNSAIYYHIKI